MRGRRSVPVALAVASVLALCGCTIDLLGHTPDASSSDGPTTDPPRDTASATTVEPFVTVAGLDVDGQHVTVSGYVAGIIEDGGLCTFLLTGPTEDHKVSGPGHVDVTSTSCGSLQIARTDLTGGEWKVVLQYTAVDGSLSQSSPRTMELP